ncbi:glycoside hydrolase family 13 protein [Lacticaseibacillus daqingensis]|uniref:glycoside hydrolase family 13 protein n=1 Tax=Lacticaseibacillus daqingensis TaxID=2486014 RepID=UPI000F7B0ACB|nr:glycoside hydrolase family 13 protein [Lacticaseibacillus daqingensis]
MNTAAMSHRPESEDCFLTPSHDLRLRLRTAKGDATTVSVICGDPYWQLPTATGDPAFAPQTVAMTRIGEGQVYDYWGVTLTAPYARMQYLFAVTDASGETVLLGDRGPRAAAAVVLQEMGNYFRVPYFHPIDAVTIPAWVADTVWYQIFPERFANGDASNDPAGTKPWRPTDHPGRNDYYGGDLQGVLDHLDDLEALGVNGLYFCPVFKASSNHKYDTIDYYEIDPDFGDKALFAKLVQAAHARGMRVMLDAVFNHLGAQSLQWQDVLANGRASRFYNWFHIHELPLTPFHDPTQDAGAPQYDTFAFEPSMPKLNTANPAVQDYLLAIATYWIRQFDIDAWRLDVANEVDHHFWRRFYAAVTAAKPDFYVLGEVWHSAQPWLNGGEFSGVMNYAFTQQIEDHFLTGAVTAPQMTARLVDQLMRYRDQTNQAMLNMLDSHDTPRLLTVAGGDLDRALNALAFTFVQPGTPCLYYGTEMGMAGANDPDDRKPMDWAQLNGPTWQRVAALVHFRRAHSQLLSAGTTAYQVTAAGLIQVTRTLGDRTLTAWFNTTATAQQLVATPVLAQGYAGDQLAAQGFVLSLD